MPSPAERVVKMWQKSVCVWCLSTTGLAFLLNFGKIKEEIIRVISKYMEIDESNTVVNMHRSDDSAILEANLAIKAIRRNIH